MHSECVVADKIEKQAKFSSGTTHSTFWYSFLSFKHLSASILFYSHPFLPVPLPKKTDRQYQRLHTQDGPGSLHIVENRHEEVIHVKLLVSEELEEFFLIGYCTLK